MLQRRRSRRNDGTGRTITPKSEADALKLRGAALAPERAFAHALGDVPPMHERMDTGTDV